MVTNDYQNDDQIKLWCGMLDGLAFLPEQLVPNGIRSLRQITPIGFDPLINYFDQTYVSDVDRQVVRPGQNPNIRNIPPRYPPAV